ncbi:MAG: hypothetical protein A2901_06750 [Elusimicrobia bacterium RIFCSPLOWO2_01_FULL_54_10]|nr:MAG: hypothetical protein A2901_06750 [Elusimicrobia bacterium RIFCSPLOWO2_01_FULL_54_10]
MLISTRAFRSPSLFSLAGFLIFSSLSAFTFSESHPIQKSGQFLDLLSPSSSFANFRSTPFGRPAKGTATSRYGFRLPPCPEGTCFHNGLDISNSPGTPITATADGRVRFAGPKGSYGEFVMMDHGNGYVTCFAHNAKLLVQEGEIVKRGQVIALMGSTGRSTGTHLHYEVWHCGRPVDPEKLMGEKFEPRLANAHGQKSLKFYEIQPSFL